MANLMVRLLLNDSDFNNKIGKSKKQLQSYQDIGKQAFGGMVTALKGFAGAAGVAFTAVESFKKVIGSSQTLTDAYGRSLEMLKTGFDNLVYAMASADFSSFNGGLAEMAARAKDAYNAMDQLANTKMSADFTVALDQSKYREAMSRARNKNLSFDERKAALEEARGYLGTIQEAGTKLSLDSEKALKAKFAAKLGIDEKYISPQMIEEAFRTDARFNSDELRKEARAGAATYKATLKQARYWETTQRNAYGQVVYKGDPVKAEAMRREALEKYSPALVKQLALERLSDEQLNADMQLYLQSVSARNAAAEMATSINEVGIAITNEMNATTAKIKGATVAAQNDSVLKYGLPTVPGGDMGANLPKTIEARQMKHSSVDDMIALGKTEAIIFESDIKQMELAAQGADNLAAAFSRVGDTIGGAAGNMLNFTAGIAEAVSQVLPFITLLWAEEQAHNANASAATKEAAAKVMASYAGIPFAGVALGAAAVASIIGIMQSIPALAKGGVVDSPTLAMIGEAGPEAVVPLDRLNDFGNSQFREVRVHGEIKASGKDLVVTIDNYNKVRKVK